jgi:acetyl esterase/lipase
MRFVSILFCALAIPAAAEVPLADFARHPQYEYVEISPDGEYLAATAIVGGKTVLSLINLANMKGANVVPREGAEVVGFSWVAPQRVMYSIGERFGGLETPVPTGELYAVNADGSGAKVLFGFRAGEDHGGTLIKQAAPERASGVLISALRDDPRHALIASYPWNESADGAFPEAYKIDLVEGTKARVASAPMRNATFIADNKGVLRLVYGSDADRKRKVFYRAGDGAAWEKVFDEGADKKRMRPIRFNRADDAVYFECGGLCRWDVASHELKVLWSGNGSEITALEDTFDNLDAFAVRSEPSRPALTLLDKSAPEATLLVGLMQQFAGAEVTFSSSSRDGKKAVVLVRSDTDPGSFFLYDAEKKKASFLLARRPWIKPEQMATQEPFELDARDGTKLHGFLTRPPGKAEAKNLPLVVFVHGGPYGVRDRWSFDPDVQMLASRGYAVLQVNFRGSGGYTDAFVQAGYREWGGKMQDDVSDATRWAVAQGVADPARMCIFGASYGGYAALEGAVREPNLYKCTIGYVGVYDLHLMYTRGDIPQSTFGESYLKTVLGENQDDLAERSPISHLDRIKAKIMLIVGGVDRRVPAVQGENLHAALLKRKIDHVWVYERTEGHGFYDEKHTTALYEQIVSFLDHSIGK